MSPKDPDNLTDPLPDSQVKESSPKKPTNKSKHILTPQTAPPKGGSYVVDGDKLKPNKEAN